MSGEINPAFSDTRYSVRNSWTNVNALPRDIKIERGQTQLNVNATVLNYLVQKFRRDAPLKMLDLPCGELEFVRYVKQLFPRADITAVDIVPQTAPEEIRFVQMDLNKPFTLSKDEPYDLITSVSGVMMFSNTQQFIENCIERLKPNGTFIVTNDNSATVLDKVKYLLYGHFRLYSLVYDEKETVTEHVPVQELCRLLRIHKMTIKDIVYTSYTLKDLLSYPVSLLLYPFHRWGISRQRTLIPKSIIRKMFPLRHLYCRHYIIIAEKQTAQSEAMPLS